MSRIPGISRSKPKHAMSTENKLRADVTRLMNRQAAADDYFAVLLADRADVYEAWQNAEAKAARAEDTVVWQDHRLCKQEAELGRLRAQLAPYLAADANANAITVPPSERDSSRFEDQATAPIDVRELRNRFAAGPVVSLHHSPQAADPTHIPAPAA
ncbi:hypothetical protein F2B00_03190 [Streptomyces parvus]|uniref:hypothetical protein n=1 Tax=Streptomyces parvus TaxID=66428 RepID=UPI00123A276A|nr:hypothetical protein [Streptomyces parvus]KAA6203637.1 hypothetical protein F2B00_03190 [Streptomyces parvus]GGS41160.1 hypothetical protein GCM10010221_44910 [Streptomyces parvus]